MSFEEFRENILQEIRARADGAFQVKKHDVIRNNNVKQAGIAVVVKEETDIGPCVYLDEFYREYESEGMKFDEIVDEVYRLIQKYGMPGRKRLSSEAILCQCQKDRFPGLLKPDHIF